MWKICLSFLSVSILERYIMWQFITGFSLGVYVGSYYDCRPAIKSVQTILSDNMPKKKDVTPLKAELDTKNNETYMSRLKWPF